LKCEAPRGICGKCDGRNLATGRMVELGEATGVIAAQSIGEPGTQLTLRTFHIGGVAGRIVEQSRIKSKIAGSVRFRELEVVERQNGSLVVVGHKGQIEVLDPEGKVRHRYSPPYGATVDVKDGAPLNVGDDLFEWIPTTRRFSRRSRERCVSWTSRKRSPSATRSTRTRAPPHGHRGRSREGAAAAHRHPGFGRRRVASYPLPTGARLLVRDGQEVTAGEPLVKIRREISKTRDITGGLPRVSELFEARKPKDAANGLGNRRPRGVRRGQPRHEEAPRGRRVGRHARIPDPPGQAHARPGGGLREGGRPPDRGPVNPHDTLKIKGIQAVQEYLVNEIQEVYRLQGVRIDDKHIEVIVRQMLQKVRIEDPGDTNFLEGEQVDKAQLRIEQRRVEAEGGQPATYQPLLLGITKASLSTQSYISSASFQETTRVLTEASVSG